VNIKFGDSQDQIESYDVVDHACLAYYMYVYSHFSLVAARSQKMETYKVDSCVYGIMYSEVFGTPHIDRVGTTGRSFLWKNPCTMPSMIL